MTKVRMLRFGAAGCVAALGLVLASSAAAYPLDAYPETGLRRLEGLRLANDGKVADVKQPPGALLPLKQVDLRLAGSTFDLPAPDPEFNRQLSGLLGGSLGGYGLAVLDLTDPARPR